MSTRKSSEFILAYYQRKYNNNHDLIDGIIVNQLRFITAMNENKLALIK